MQPDLGKERERDNSQQAEPKRDGDQPFQINNYVNVPSSSSPEQLIQSAREVARAANVDRPFRRRREWQPRSRADFFLAKLVRIAWEAGGLAFLGFLNLIVISGGLIELSPTIFGVKLSKMPGFGSMAGYAMWNNVLVAQVITVGFFCGMAVCWKFMIKDLLLRRATDTLDPDRWDLQRARMFWRVTGIGMMICDALLFYYGVTQSNQWLPQTNWFTAIVSTAIYFGCVAIYASVCLYLSDWERSE